MVQLPLLFQREHILPSDRSLCKKLGKHTLFEKWRDVGNSYIGQFLTVVKGMPEWRLWASYFTALGLSFSICRMRKVYLVN
jgi:hypothetical protein